MPTYLCVIIFLLAVSGVSSQEDGSVILAGDPNPHIGRVEVFLNGEWGTVCGDSWGIKDGHVVCRQLGYSGVAHVKRGAVYGEGGGPIHMTDVECDGSESRLFECDHSRPSPDDCGYNGDAGVACHKRPTDCGFSDDGSSGNISFRATSRGTCSVTIESTSDELVIISYQSYSFATNTVGKCVNYVKEYGDNHEFDYYCGNQNLPQDFVVHVNRYEIMMRTKDITRSSRLEANFRRIDASISCNFEDPNECDMNVEGTPWTRGTTATTCDWYDVMVAGTSLGTDEPGATFKLSIMPSREVALSFRYASSECWRSPDDARLIVNFCEKTPQVPGGGYFLDHFYCPYPADTIIFTVETTSGSFVYVDDIRVWYLDETVTTVRPAPTVVATTSASRTSSKVRPNTNYEPSATPKIVASSPASGTDARGMVSVDDKFSGVPTTSSNDGASPITDARGVPTLKNSMNSGNNAGLNDEASAPVIYVIPAALLVLVLLIALILGFVILRRRKKNSTSTADASVSYNNRTYDTGTPIQMPVSGDQLQNVADQGEVHNPAYQHSGDDRGEVYNVAYGSSGDGIGEKSEYDHALPGPGPGAASEYQYVVYRE